MATLVDKIKHVLQREGRKLNALEIRRALESILPKSDINQCLFSNQNIFLKSNEQPPRWSLLSPLQTTVDATSSKYVLPGLPTLDIGASPMAEVFNNPTTSGPSQPAAASSNETLEDKILGILQNTTDPLPALTVAKQVGLKTAKQVNPTLYKIEKEGKIKSTKIPGTTRPVWAISRGRGMSFESQAASNSVLQSGIATSPQPSIGNRELYVKDENEIQVIFTKVNSPSDPSPVIEPVTVSEGQGTPQPPHSIQESTGQAGERVQRPTQVMEDDRHPRDPDPVSTPDPINFATRNKQLGQNEVKQAKKVVLFKNTTNNIETETDIASPSQSSVISLETTSSPLNTPVIDTASLSSLTLDDQSATSPGPSEASPSSEGGPRTSRKKAKNLKMGIRFPDKDKK